MVIRDSISKFDYTNPYDTKQYPFQTPASRASHVERSFTKDVLEISEDNLTL